MRYGCFQAVLAAMLAVVAQAVAAQPSTAPAQEVAQPRKLAIVNKTWTGDFDRLDRGDEVYYVEDVGDTGPIASKVRVKAEA